MESAITRAHKSKTGSEKGDAEGTREGEAAGASELEDSCLAGVAWQVVARESLRRSAATKIDKVFLGAAIYVKV